MYGVGSANRLRLHETLAFACYDSIRRRRVDADNAEAQGQQVPVMAQVQPGMAAPGIGQVQQHVPAIYPQGNGNANL